MKRKQKIKAFTLIIALLMILSSYLTICASAMDILQFGNKDTEEKVYANANINEAFADDTVLVVLKNKISINCNVYSVSDFAEINAYSVEHLSAPLETRIKTAVENIKYSVQSGREAEIDDNLNIDEFYQVLKIKLSEHSKDRVLDAIKILEKNNDVLYVGPDYYLTYASQNYDYYEYQTYMSDFAEQWAYSHIQLDEAWQYMDSVSLSNASISVGVIDSGIYANHPALDINTNNSNTYGDNTVTGAGVDAYYHGTQVAGIIQGVARNVDIISLKVSESWIVKSSDVYQVFINIDKNAIPIINFSLYWKTAQGSALSNNYDCVIASAMNAYGGLIVCAAGNDGKDIDYDNIDDYFPIQHVIPKMIVVGASTKTDNIKSDSNCGENYVDVFAPGVDLYTTTYTGGYTNSAEKTSMATPWVTGLATMLMMVDEDLSPEQIINIIIDTVDKDTIYNHSNYVNPENGADLDELEDLCRSDGRINAYQAVKQAYQSRNCSHTTLTYSRTEISHIRRCSRCNLAMEAEETHAWEYLSNGSTGHKAICELCNYIDNTVEAHDLYIMSEAPDDYTIACKKCDYTFGCTESPEYYGTSAEGHEASCPDGCYTVFEPHEAGVCRPIGDQYYHRATCAECGYVYLGAHTWSVLGNQSLCSGCGQLSNHTPITPQNLPPLEIGDEIMIIVPGGDVEIDLPPVKDEELTE